LTASGTGEISGTKEKTKLRVLAEELGGAARAELWPNLVAEWPKPVEGSPDLGAAQAGSARQFPVFLLTRQH
jgi:hypothetical protein